MSGNYNDRYSVLWNKKSNNSTTKCGSNLNSFSKAKTALTAKVALYLEMHEWTDSKIKIRDNINMTSSIYLLLSIYKVICFVITNML